MGSWSLFWGVVFACTLAVYAVLAIVVSVGGWRDILAMFKQLDRQHEGGEPIDREEVTTPDAKVAKAADGEKKHRVTGETSELD